MTAATVTGTLPPIPTFLSDEGEVDEKAMHGIVGMVLDSGAEGVVVLGTSGEGMAMDEPRRSRALAASCAAASSATVVAGCHGQTAAEALERLSEAAACGATVGLVPPPFYYPLGQAALLGYYREIADRSPLPILVYHIPPLTRNELSLDSLAELSAHERIVGMKDSHGAALAHLELLRLQNDGFKVLQGVAPLLLSSYAAGSAGGITPVSALFPHLELGLRAALEQGDVPAAGVHIRQIQLVASLLRSGGYPLVTNLKAVARVLGLGGPRVLSPAPTASEAHHDRLRRELATARLLLTA